MSIHSLGSGAGGGAAGGTYSGSGGGVSSGPVKPSGGGDGGGVPVVASTTSSTTGVETPETRMPMEPSSVERLSVVVAFARDSASLPATVTIVSTSMEVDRSLRRVTVSVTVPITTLETCVENARATPVV